MSKLLKQHNSVIKHIINLPLPNSFPLCRANPGEAPLSNRDKLIPLTTLNSTFHSVQCLSEVAAACWELQHGTKLEVKSESELNTRLVYTHNTIRGNAWSNLERRFIVASF